MITGYITESNIYTSLAEQKEMILRYATKLGISDIKFEKIPTDKNILSCPVKKNDIMISDVSILGSRFEDIMLALKIFSERKLKIYSVKEKLEIDTVSQSSFMGNIDICLKVYKGIFSLKNAQIQKNLLKQGKSRGRPVGTGKSGLDEKKSEIKQLLSCGVKVTEIAKMLGVNSGTLHMFIKRRKLKVK